MLHSKLTTLMAATDSDSNSDDRPGKRARLSRYPRSPSQQSDFDDTEDFYESPDTPHPSQTPNHAHPKPYKTIEVEESRTGSIPGLGLLKSPTSEAELQAPEDQSLNAQAIGSNGTLEFAPLSVVHHQEQNVQRRPIKSLEPYVVAVSQEEAGLDTDARGNVKVDFQDDVLEDVITEVRGASSPEKDIASEIAVDADFQPSLSAAANDNSKSRGDSENRDDKDHEWQYESSDGKSDHSSNLTSSSDSGISENSGDETYELLGPEEQARILMEEGGSEDEDKESKLGSRSQPRTANEKPDEIIPKPDVIVTEDMKFPELGIAEGVVENYLLIRGTISGETRVLESGSILCLQDRTVIGVVAETLGRVEAPLYSVAFASPQEVKRYGIDRGTKIFYVEDHSTYVFTQPLKMLKGSDASNIHDEEVGDDQLEFSDDEVEAEHKRRMKQMKQSNKGKLPNSACASSTQSGSSLSRTAYSTQYPAKPISYDEEDADEMYTPLARPSSLLEQSLPPKPPTLSKQARSYTGRGRDGRGRGQRVTKDNERSGRNHRWGGRGPALTQTETQSQARREENASSATASASKSSYHAHQSMSGKPEGFPAQHLRSPVGPPQRGYWPQSQQSPYWSTDYSHFATSYGTSYQSPTTPLPPGSFVNPAFFRNQQQSPPPATPSYQYPQSYGQPNVQGSYQQATFPVDPPSSELKSTIEEYDPTRPWID